MARYVFALWVNLMVAVGVCGPTLAATVTVQLDNYPLVVRVYDMNGDGHLDIVTAADDVDNTADWVLTVLRGYGNTSGHVGQFYPAQTKDLILDDETFVLTDLGLGKAGGYDD